MLEIDNFFSPSCLVLCKIRPHILLTPLDPPLSITNLSFHSPTSTSDWGEAEDSDRKEQSEL